MAISSPDQALYRGQDMQTLDPTLCVVPTEIIATAEVQTAPATYPIASIAVTNTSANWLQVDAGYFYRITDTSGNIVKWGVVRLDATASTLFIDGKSQGDPGVATLIHRSIQAGDIITVYRIKPLWTLLSRIANGVFFKKFDVAYDGSGSSPNPILNMGKHQIIKVYNSGENGIVVLDASGSIGQKNKSVTAWLWTLPAEAVVISGSTTSSSLTISLPQGYYEIFCRITDSGSKTFTGMRSVWVVGPDNPPLSDTYGLEITSDDSDTKGREMTFKISGTNVGDGVILPGTMIAFADFPRFGTSTITEGSIIDYFVGFVGERIEVYEDGVTGERSVTFTARSPYKWLETIPQVSQVIVETAVPNSWEKVSVGLGHINFVIWYIIKHHTTCLELFDFSPLPESTPPRKRAWGMNGGSIAQQCEEVVSAILGNIGSKSDGTIMIRRDPNVEENAYRDSLDNLLTWTLDDLTEEITINRRFLNETAYVRVYALAMQSSNQTVAYASIAPGTQQGQSINSSQYDNILLPIGSGQTEVNILAGMLYAKENNPIADIPLAVQRNFDVCDPADMVWHTLDVQAAQTSINKRFFTRVLPKTVSRSWEQTDSQSWVKTIEISVLPETFGQPGIKLPINPGDGINFPAIPTFDVPIGSIPPEDSGEQNTEGIYNGYAIAVDNNPTFPGQAARTTSFNNSSPAFVSISDDFTGNIAHAIWDTGSDIFVTGTASDPVGAWFVTQESTTVRLYHQSDIRDSETITLITTATMNDAFAYTNAIVRQDPENANLIVFAWKDRTGTRYRRSQDGGQSWSATAHVGEVITDTETNDNAFIGLDIYDGVQVISAPDALGAYGVYKADTPGDTWDEVANTIRTVRPQPMIKIIPGVDTLLVTEDNGGTALVEYFVDFGDNSTATYNISTTASGTTASVSSLGPGSDNAARATAGNTPAAAPNMTVELTFDTPTPVTFVSFDWLVNINFDDSEFVAVDNGYMFEVFDENDNIIIRFGDILGLTFTPSEGDPEEWRHFFFSCNLDTQSTMKFVFTAYDNNAMGYDFRIANIKVNKDIRYRAKKVHFDAATDLHATLEATNWTEDNTPNTDGIAGSSCLKFSMVNPTATDDIIISIPLDEPTIVSNIQYSIKADLDGDFSVFPTRQNVLVDQLTDNTSAGESFLNNGFEVPADGWFTRSTLLHQTKIPAYATTSVEIVIPSRALTGTWTIYIDDIYVHRAGPDSDESVVTLDSGGYGSYTLVPHEDLDSSSVIGGAGWSDITSGYTGDKFITAFDISNSYASITVEVSMGATKDIIGVGHSFWYNIPAQSGDGPNSGWALIDGDPQNPLLDKRALDSGGSPYFFHGQPQIWETSIGYYRPPNHSNQGLSTPWSVTDVYYMNATQSSIISANQEIRLDNMWVAFDEYDEADQQQIAGELWRVPSFTGAATWSNVTPTDANPPVVPDGLNFDVTNGISLKTYFADPSNGDVWKSTTTGFSWTKISSNTNARVVRAKLTNIAIAGDGIIKYSNTTGSSYSDKSGNMSSVIANYNLKQFLVL